MVTTHKWQKIEEILTACWELEPHQREQFLQHRCLPDTELLAEVLRFYHADSSADHWQPPKPDNQTVTRFGQYELERQIGRGGMGAVYLAHRADGEFQQSVAIKIIGLPFEPAEMRERFRRERQILAGLNHPNITRLLDGGITDQGQLYLVMEYVDGLPINKFPATSDTKLNLFTGVCAAVQYAHQNLIIHRDIKPSNIIVSRDGVPKLLDFGAAKLLAESDATQTGFGMATLAYASPEQLRGEPASTLGDVFSLGVVLYELITGQKPFGENLTARLNAGDADVLALPQPLPGDLDTVVRKALAAAPSDRYQSVEQLAEDVRRYQAGEPVLAHPPSFGYRSRRFLQRHWLPVSLAAVFVIALAVTATIALQQAAAAKREATSAEKEVARQKKLTNFLEEMLASGSRGEGDIPLSKVLDDVEPVLAQTFKDDPITEASLRMNLGASYTTLQKPDRAKFEMDKALAAFRAAGDAKGQVVVLWLLGQTSVTQGRAHETANYYQQALELLNNPQTKAKPIWVFRVKRDLARALLLLATSRSELERVRILVQEAIAIGNVNPSISPIREIASARSCLTILLLRSGQLERAKQELDRAPSLAQVNTNDIWVLLAQARVAAQQRDFITASAKTSLLTINFESPLLFARYRAETGQVAQAVAQVRAQLPGLLRDWDRDIQIEPLSNAAHVMLCAKRYSEAETYARQLLQILDTFHHELTDPQRADAEELLASALTGQKHYTQAAPLFAQSEQTYRNLGPGFKIAADHVAQLRHALPASR